MKLSELLAMLRENAKKFSVSDSDFLAINFRMTDMTAPDIDNDDQQKEPGVFYIEIKNGRVDIQPYRYNDTDCTLCMKTDNFLKMMNGKLDGVAAFTLGKLKIDGNIEKALAFSNLLKNTK